MYKYVSQGLNPKATLNNILSGKMSDDSDAGTPLSNLYKLYGAALEDAIGTSRDNTKSFQVIIGAIATTRIPLSVRALTALLEGVIEPQVILNLEPPRLSSISR
jgi:hypothetical protein